MKYEAAYGQAIDRQVVIRYAYVRYNNFINNYILYLGYSNQSGYSICGK